MKLNVKKLVSRNYCLMVKGDVTKASLRAEHKEFIDLIIKEGYFKENNIAERIKTLNNNNNIFYNYKSIFIK